jgi:NAD(P)-dependent dehydrogenase (short-subunit alcohol dehydrogenase family)
VTEGRTAIVTGASRGIGSAITFLASSDASWVTGATLVIDGGRMVGAGAAFEALSGESRRP